MEEGFHFLGIDYAGTQTLEEYTSEAAQGAIESNGDVLVDNIEGGGSVNQPLSGAPNIALQQAPHARTFRRAREQVKWMIEDGFSARVIQTYLLRWARWWVRTVKQWQVLALLNAFQAKCFDDYLKIFIEALIQERFSEDPRPVVPLVHV